LQERSALLQLVRVSAPCSGAEMRQLRKVQDLSF
jgi:hypothetical protein